LWSLKRFDLSSAFVAGASGTHFRFCLILVDKEVVSSVKNSKEHVQITSVLVAFVKSYCNKAFEKELAAQTKSVHRKIKR
jgi:hypothetical protein